MDVLGMDMGKAHPYARVLKVRALYKLQIFSTSLLNMLLMKIFMSAINGEYLTKPLLYHHIVQCKLQMLTFFNTNSKYKFLWHWYKSISKGPWSHPTTFWANLVPQKKYDSNNNLLNSKTLLNAWRLCYKERWCLYT